MKAFARLCAGLLTSAAWFLALTSDAVAGDCATEGGVGSGYIELDGTCSDPPGGDPGTSGPNQPAGDSDPAPYSAYRWASMCTKDPTVRPGDVDCAAADACPDPQQRLWQLWGRLPNGSWTTVTTGCFGGVPPAYEPPTVTPGQVLEAIRRVGLPELPTVVQPAGKTLVNFDTNFYTEPQPVTLSLTLLGQAVQVEATPATYRWDFGDGTSDRKSVV